MAQIRCLPGVAIAVATTQHALRWARQRVQAAKLGGSREPLWIIAHAGCPPHADHLPGAYLRMMGVTIGGWLLAQQALVSAARIEAGDTELAFIEAKICAARFFAPSSWCRKSAPCLALYPRRGAATLSRLQRMIRRPERVSCAKSTHRGRK